MRNAVIVSAVRTAVGKAPRGGLRTVRPDDMAAEVVRAAIERAGVEPVEVEDVSLGCAFPEAEQGMNLARIAALRAGLPVSVAGQTVNRFCASGLQTVASATQQIMAGMGDAIVAGGVESMSMIPMVGNKFAPNPTLAEKYPDTYLGMGLTAENVARQFDISREDQDAFALRSHRRAAAAQDAGWFDGQIAPLPSGSPCRKRGVDGHDPVRLRPGRRRAPRYEWEGAGRIAAGVPRGRLRHRRQQQPDQRRGRRSPADERSACAGARRGAHGPPRQLRRGGRASRDHGRRARWKPCPRRCSAQACPWTTST